MFVSQFSRFIRASLEAMPMQGARQEIDLSYMVNLKEALTIQVVTEKNNSNLVEQHGTLFDQNLHEHHGTLREVFERNKTNRQQFYLPSTDGTSSVRISFLSDTGIILEEFQPANT